MKGYRGKNLTYVKIGGEKLCFTMGDITENRTTSTISTRNDDSAGYEDKLLGDQDITITGTFLYALESDLVAGQLALIGAAVTNSEIPIVEWAYETAVGSKNFTANAGITSWTETAGDPQTIAFTLAILDKPVVGVQA